MGTWILLPLFLVVPDNGPEETGRVAVLQALAAYHQGLEAGEVQKVLGVLGPSCFMADERSSGGPKRLSAHLFLTGEKLQAWPKKFLGEAGPYRNASEPLSVSIRGDAAVAVTRDTGRNRFRRWQQEEVAWFLGRSDGQWRICGFIIRDIQLPKQK